MVLSGLQTYNLWTPQVLDQQYLYYTCFLLVTDTKHRFHSIYTNLGFTYKTTEQRDFLHLQITILETKGVKVDERRDVVGKWKDG